MKVALIGGGINGLCAAWKLAEDGHDVELFERGTLLGETSSNSSKLLHGGIRYLENYEFKLVKEALKERAWWIKNVPEFAKPLKLCLPVYESSKRPAWLIELGLFFYDKLAGKENIGSYKRVSLKDSENLYPNLKQGRLKKVYTFFDGQMDEEKLGAWVATQAREAGVKVFESSQVQKVNVDGQVFLQEKCLDFDMVVNICGPWAKKLLEQSDIKTKYELDLVRGSHLVLDKPISEGYFLEVPNEKRFFFVLPYQGRTLVGTTEVRQKLDDSFVCSEMEKEYLLNAYNYYFKDYVDSNSIVSSFAGVRPLIFSSLNPSKATREYAIERNNRLINVFGGKWTTARSLARKIALEIRRGVT